MCTESGNDEGRKRREEGSDGLGKAIEQKKKKTRALDDASEMTVKKKTRKGWPPN